MVVSEFNPLKVNPLSGGSEPLKQVTQKSNEVQLFLAVGSSGSRQTDDTQVVRIVPDFRPEDKENEGAGAPNGDGHLWVWRSI